MILAALYVTAYTTAVSSVSKPPVPGVTLAPLQNTTEIGNRTSFHYYYLTASGECHTRKPYEVHISIAATNNVAEKALIVACHTLAKITRYMPGEVFVSTSKSSGVGIFKMAETLAAFPENADLADRPQCYGRCDGDCTNTCTFDGRKWSTVPGITNTISVVNMESVLCMKKNVYRGNENIISHEFAHLIHSYIDGQWKNKISVAYQNARQHNLWRMDSYTMSTAYEYFAMASETFLGSITRRDTITTGGMNLCKSGKLCRGVSEARKFLKRQDPMIFEVLSYIYTNNDASKFIEIKPCEK